MAIYSSDDSRAAPRRAERSLRSVRARATGFMFVALAAGVGSAWMVVRYVRGHSGHVQAVPTVRVVVASSDIPVAGSLTPDVLKVVDWPASVQPQGSFPTVQALSGRVASTALVAGEPVVEARLAPAGAGAGIASLIPADMRAMTVQVNDVVGVSGFIHPGDLVDVITTMQGPPAPGTPMLAGQTELFRSKIVLQNIRVLAVGQQLTADTNKPQQVPSVTLLVSPEESERLALASTQGKLQLTMRSQLDKGQLDTTGVSPPELLEVARTGALPPAAAPAPAAARAAAPVAHHHTVLAAAPPPPAAPTSKPVEVVEVMRGDRIEHRNVKPGAPL